MRGAHSGVIKDSSGRRMYTASPPWWLKLGVLYLYYQQRVSVAADAAPEPRGATWLRPASLLLAGHAVLSLAALLPSCVYAVRSRARTTAFAVQSMLMLTALTVVLVMCSGPHENMGPLALQLALVHALWAEAGTLRTQRSVLLWQDAACRLRFVTAAVAPVLAMVLVPRPSMESISALGMVLVLFTGEGLGIGVSCAHAVLEAAGRLWEGAVWE